MVFTSAAGAQDVAPVKNGWYIGGGLVHNGMSGDFDDSTYYYTESDFYNVPDVDSGTGFGIVVGTRMNRFSYEFGYQRTAHDVSSAFIDVGNDATYSVLDLDAKFDILSKGRLRPHVLLGIGLTWLDIEDNAVNLYSTELQDETFRGYCWNLGAGLSYYFQPQLAITGGVKYRWNTYGTVDGNDLEKDLKQETISTTVGVSYTF
jgi:opacity protein-like surface antigen